MRGRTDEHWWGVAVEAPDPGALARFYTALLGWPIVHEDTDTAVVKPPQDGVFLVFQRASGYVAPRWPPEEGAQRVMAHLDVQVTDLDLAVADALALGATLVDTQPQPNVRVLLDPAGHPFCLCVDADG